MQLNTVKIVCFILCDFYHHEENILKRPQKKKKRERERGDLLQSLASKLDILTKVPLGVLEKV